ncbi:MAG: hypothetical protein K1X92_04585 [Bacteroidia bacterium]|nr:hypothetical protein [Bacteroidia bacterium]
MKIRIKGNSVRYRLTKSEVAKLCNEGYLEETTHFPAQNLIYALAVKPGSTHLSAGFEGNKITVFFPESEQKTWDESNVVGYEHHFELPDGGKLFLLVEKDFVCLDNTLEDQSDNYENPNAVC